MKKASAIVLSAVLCRAATAHADAQKCIEDHEKGTEARRNGRLVESAARFNACRQQACPSVIRDECAARATETAAALPSVVFAASDETGNDLVSVTVHVDGVTATTRLDGRPHGLDPGEHTISFETPGRTTVVRRIVVGQGEKERRIAATMIDARAARQQVDRPATGPSIPAIVLGGVGVVALGTFVGFAIAGRSKESDLDACAPRCAPDEVDVMQRRYLIADIALAVSALSLGGSLVLFLTHHPSSGGAASSELKLRGRF